MRQTMYLILLCVVLVLTMGCTGNGASGRGSEAFIDGYRVDHAARLLTDTDEPIALIAEMSGFANRTSFNERFRERYKMTPSEYRRAAKA